MDKATAIRVIEPLIPMVYEGLEIGTADVQTYFPNHEKPINLVLAASMTRYWLRDHLKDRAPLVDDCETEDIANNGVSVRISGVHLRVWKNDGGEEPPSSGLSRTKDAFLRQKQGTVQLRFEWAEKVIHNLVLLWEVDSTYSLTGLRLASPRGGITENSRPEWEWNVPVDPADVIGSLAPLIGATQDLDIPFKRLDEEDKDAVADDEAKDENA